LSAPNIELEQRAADRLVRDVGAELAGTLSRVARTPVALPSVASPIVSIAPKSPTPSQLRLLPSASSKISVPVPLQA
jgi:hypothetical protein